MIGIAYQVLLDLFCRVCIISLYICFARNIKLNYITLVMAKNFAEVIVNIPTKSITNSYYYSVPDNLKEKVSIGHLVKVPFGRQIQTGFVIGFCDKVSFPTKEIIEILAEEPFFSEELLRTSKWVSKYYLCSLHSALELIVPFGKDIRFKKGRLYFPKKREKHKEYIYEKITEQKEIILTDEQKNAVEKIISLSQKGIAKTVLLYGVTGSGKTEVYIRVISHITQLGKKAIVLVPEISLTPQIEERFRAHFKNRLAVLHSKVPHGARYDIYKKIQRGEIDIIIGVRSAIFAPLANIGVIVVDEEQDTSYKQENVPRYNAREVAKIRVKQNNAILILGSATPSLETYLLAKKGVYELICLTKRIDDIPLPKIEVVDMRKEMKNKKGILSEKLTNEIKNVISRNQQVLLFLNRRGFSNAVQCKECGFVFQCNDCAVSLTYHKTQSKLICHYCNRKEDTPYICKQCQSPLLLYKGIGIQQVEDQIKRTFENVKILRMDRDTTGKKFSHYEIINKFEKKQADILLGTQMIAKGLDFPGVHLAGVILADIGFHIPDFRASERAYQTLTQLAGRAGRKGEQGKVIIQTYLPEHPIIQTVLLHNLEEFFKKEISVRRNLFYPPFSHLINLQVTHHDEKKVISTSEKFLNILQCEISKMKLTSKYKILGPSPSAILKLKNKYRYHILIKCKGQNEMLNAVRSTLSKLTRTERDIISVDVDPQNLM